LHSFLPHIAKENFHISVFIIFQKRKNIERLITLVGREKDTVTLSTVRNIHTAALTGFLKMNAKV